MNYMLLIHQGSTPTPGTEEWDALPEDERQAVYAAYGAINATPGVTAGRRMQPPERVRRGLTQVSSARVAALRIRLQV